MVFESIKALKERNGSSIQAIKKHITASHPTLNFTPHQMRSALKKGTEAGKFIKVRASLFSTQHQFSMYAVRVSGVCSPFIWSRSANSSEITWITHSHTLLCRPLAATTYNR